MSFRGVSDAELSELTRKQSQAILAANDMYAVLVVERISRLVRRTFPAATMLDVWSDGEVCYGVTAIKSDEQSLGTVGEMGEDDEVALDNALADLHHVEADLHVITLST